MENKKILKTAKRHIKLSQTLKLSAFTQSLVLLTIVGIVLYSVFFTSYQDVHDYFHELRHGLMMVPCH
jgi:hypothetical protein